MYDPFQYYEADLDSEYLKELQETQTTSDFIEQQMIKEYEESQKGGKEWQTIWQRKM